MEQGQVKINTTVSKWNGNSNKWSEGSLQLSLADEWIVVLAHVQLKSFYPLTSLTWENLPGPLPLNGTASDEKLGECTVKNFRLL